MLLLGIMYHVFDHLELVRLVAQTGASHVIVDTQVILERPVHHKQPAVIALKVDDVTYAGAQAVANSPGGGGSHRRPTLLAAPCACCSTPSASTRRSSTGRGCIAAQKREAVKDVWHYEHGSRTTFRMTRRPPASPDAVIGLPSHNNRA